MSEQLNGTEYTALLKSNYRFSISNSWKYIPKYMTENKLDAFTNCFSSVCHWAAFDERDKWKKAQQNSIRY